MVRPFATCCCASRLCLAPRPRVTSFTGLRRTHLARGRGGLLQCSSPSAHPLSSLPLRRDHTHSLWPQRQHHAGLCIGGLALAGARGSGAMSFRPRWLFIFITCSALSSLFMP